MVMFKAVDPASINTNRLGRRGRVSYPLLKSFLEANIKLAQLDIKGLDKNPQYLRSVLTSYIKSHDLPIKMFASGGQNYLMRLDLLNDGSPDPDWKGKRISSENIDNEMAAKASDLEEEDEDNERPTEGAAGHMRGAEPKPINAEEVSKRFAAEVGQVTK